MRGLLTNIAILAASSTLAACGGSTVTPVSSQSAVGAPGSVAQALADAATRQRITKLLRGRIKHVFVLVQENHTFDQEFGLFPGMKGQSVNNLGTYQAQQVDCQYDPVAGGCQRPFLITTNSSSPNYVPDAPDINGGDNGRYGQEYAIDRGKMDGFLAEDEAGQLPLGPTPSPQQIEQHNEDIAIEASYDCDTIPYLWYYAKNFALFDNYFQGNTGDSTPANVQLFAGQTGQTEAALGEGVRSQPYASGGGYTDGVPISNDDNPPTSQLPFAITSYSGDNGTFQSYATMPVMLSPKTDNKAERVHDVGYIAADMKKEAHARHPSYPWAWYEEGLYTSGVGFSAHHTAPLYFDYINSGNSPFASKQTLRDNTASNGLITDIKNNNLPSEGVFWVKGGNANSYGLKPADPIFTNNPSGKRYFVGDDDHPGSGSSDHQVAEAYLAEVVNAIAKSKYWKDSIIVVTWDDSGGFFDHAPPTEYGSTCPQDVTGPESGYSCGQGVRVPAMVISRYSKTGVVVHDLSDHGSVSKLIEAIFGLTPFGLLPDESTGASEGLSPSDGNPYTSNLLDAIDENKLHGDSPNPPSLAEISSPSSPPNMSCATLNITPIPSPTSLPAGFATAGYYLHQQLEGSRHAVRLPNPRDDND
jgi:phospholipase C